MPEFGFCPVYGAIQLLQEKWTLHIIRALLDGALGFNELNRAIGPCSPATLSQRVDRLETAGVVRKTIQSTMPPRTSYALTDDGVALHGVIDAIDAWSSRMGARLLPDRDEPDSCRAAS